MWVFLICLYKQSSPKMYCLLHGDHVWHTNFCQRQKIKQNRNPKTKHNIDVIVFLSHHNYCVYCWKCQWIQVWIEIEEEREKDVALHNRNNCDATKSTQPLKPMTKHISRRDPKILRFFPHCLCVSENKGEAVTKNVWPRASRLVCSFH